MNGVLANSECNSGCESGWTLYLEHSFIPSHHRANDEFVNKRGGLLKEEKRDNDSDEDEEEDLSMVSDASSGPRHFHEEEDYRVVDRDNGCFYHSPIDAKLRRGSIGKRQKIKEHSSFQLDDTASSPIFNWSNNKCRVSKKQASIESNLDFSQGYSATHCDDRTSFHGHFAFFQSSLSENQLQQNQ